MCSCVPASPASPTSLFHCYPPPPSLSLTDDPALFIGQWLPDHPCPAPSQRPAHWWHALLNGSSRSRVLATIWVYLPLYLSLSLLPPPSSLLPPPSSLLPPPSSLLPPPSSLLPPPPSSVTHQTSDILRCLLSCPLALAHGLPSG